MGHVVLYCAETPNLKLGPGTLSPLDTTSQQGGTPASPGSEQVIIFVDGFADVDTAKMPDWEKWVKHPGTPFIEINPEAGLVPLDEGFACEKCANTRTPKAFETKRQLAGHMMSHRER